MLCRSLRRGVIFPIKAVARMASSSFKPPVEVHKVDKKLIPTSAETNSEELLKYFKEMTLHRRVEIACDESYKRKEIRGFCHLMDGQEAVSVGVEAGITPMDHIITAYREHGIALSRGESPEKLIAELLGKATGRSKGKGGSMHLTLKEKRFYGGNGIVGSQVPIGTGIAFGIKYEAKPEVCVAMYGDGAANQGQVFEAANMAKLWNLPVIYLCENNLYAMGTSIARASANTKLYTKLDPIPGIKADGQNIFAVREAVKFARKWCLEGNGPICLELVTYRYHGHSMSDAGLTYRNRDEILKVRKERDPIILLKGIIMENKAATEDELKKIEKDIRKTVEEAYEKAKAAPFPDPNKDLFTDVYGSPPEDCMSFLWLFINE